MRCPDCGREVKDDAAVCRACGFAFDPALLDAPPTAQSQKKPKSGFTKSHSVVKARASPPGSQDRFVDTAPTDSTEGAAQKDRRSSSDEPIDVFATSPGGPAFPEIDADDDDDLSESKTRPVPTFSADRTVRAPAPDLGDLVDATQEHAATVVHDMASALAAAGLRPGSSDDPEHAGDDEDARATRNVGDDVEEDAEPTKISPPPAPSSRPKTKRR